MSIIPVDPPRPVVVRHAGERGGTAVHDKAVVGGILTWLVSTGCPTGAPLVRSMGLSVLLPGLTLGGFVVYRVRQGMEGVR